MMIFPIFFADQASGNYLLIHGTADDNVHFQNAIELVMALNEAGFQYEQFFYPNKITSSTVETPDYISIKR